MADDYKTRMALVAAGIEQARAALVAREGLEEHEAFKNVKHGSIIQSSDCEDDAIATLSMSAAEHAEMLEEHMETCDDPDCSVKDEEPNPFVGIHAKSRADGVMAMQALQTGSLTVRHSYPVDEAFALGCRIIAACQLAEERSR